MFLQSNSSGKWESYCARELWQAFAANNRGALSELFLRYYDRLYRYGMSFSSNKEAVKDGIQKLFFRLWEKRKKLNVPQSIDGYLYVSMRRIMLRINERTSARKQRHSRYMMSSSLHKITPIEKLIIFREKRKERKEIFRRALKSLTPRQKEALLLRIDSGMSNSEIADIMTVSNKTVRNLIYEATKRLKEEIGSLVNAQAS